MQAGCTFESSRAPCLATGCRVKITTMQSKLISVDQARQRITDAVGLLSPRRTDLAAAQNRVLAEPLVADMDFPPFDRSLMDGYAVRAADLNGSKTTLRIIGEIAAGQPPNLTVSEGQAASIMTGAPIPDGTDAVVPIEQAVVHHDRLTITKEIQPGLFIMPRGGEAKQDQRILEAGVVLGPAQLAVAAAVGSANPSVYPSPGVTIIATGDELVGADATPGPSQIRNTNIYSLTAQARQMGCRVKDLGAISDNAETLEAAISTGLRDDLLLICGGASVGRYDLVPALLKQLGVERIVEKVAVRPGKPLCFGRLAEHYVFALPGNPVSTFVCFALFVAPVIRKMTGNVNLYDSKISASLSGPMAAVGPRQTYWPGELTCHCQRQKPFSITPLPWVGSGDLFTLARANALIERAPHAPAASLEDLVEVLPFNAIA